MEEYTKVGIPAPSIAKTAERLGADLILFGMYGKVGLDAFWNRSDTAAVARQTQIKLLLILLSN